MEKTHRGLLEVLVSQQSRIDKRHEEEIQKVMELLRDMEN
jgi:hypothetical protein